MTTLSNLVKYKNELSIAKAKLSLHDNVLEKINLLTRIDEDYKNQSFGLSQQIENFKKIIDFSNQISDGIDSMISDIESYIDNTAIEQFKNSQIDSSSLLPTNTELELLIKSRIGGYSEFRFPGLQICKHVFDEKWLQDAGLQTFASPSDRIHSMLACDPLYLAGGDSTALREIIKVFPEQYQRRVGIYEIKNQDLSILPQNQFGLVLCWDILNYCTLDTIQHYLKEFIKILRPGGVLFFSYNNCDIEKSAENAEHLLAGWASTRLIKKLISDVGFEIISFNDYPADDFLNTWVSWAEIKKPGELSTVKRSQAQGLVMRK